MADVRCGNQDCPEQPAINEPANIGFDERHPCPVCGSRIRRFSVRSVDAASAGWRGFAEAAGEALAGAVAGPAAAATLRGLASLNASGVVEPAPSKLRVVGLGLEVTHAVSVYMADLEDRPDSPCVIEVRNQDGDVLVTGVGATPADAVAYIFEYMLPPDSSDYLEPNDGMPDHDTD